MRSNLYIHHSNYGLFYDDGSYCYPYDKRNTLLHAATITGLRKQKKNVILSTSSYIWDYDILFLEDYFDPKTRIKRGRLFKKSNCAQPVSLYPSGTGGIYHISSGSNSELFFKYEPYRPTIDFVISKRINLSLGYGAIKNRWELILIDEIHSQEEVLTLKNSAGFKDTPVLDETQVPSRHYKILLNEYNALLDDITSLPESVIDHCRDFATKLLASKLNLNIEDQKDLGKMINKFDKSFPKDFEIVKNCARIINRLHPRRKPNEYETRGLEPLSDFDSELAVKCSFAMIKELGWSQF